MNNLTNELKHFTEVKSFRESYKSLSSDAVIYVFLYTKNINRLEGSSPILKIGETTNFKKRMVRYLNVQNIDDIKHKPNRQTAYRLRRFIDSKDVKNIKLLYKISSKTSKKDLRHEEKRLLKLYLNEHSETPPLNMGLS